MKWKLTISRGYNKFSLLFDRLDVAGIMIKTFLKCCVPTGDEDDDDKPVEFTIVPVIIDKDSAVDDLPWT